MIDQKSQSQFISVYVSIDNRQADNLQMRAQHISNNSRPGVKCAEIGLRLGKG